MQITFLIPCLNEERTIARVIKTAHAAGVKHFPRNFEILIADNGSTDGTLKKIAQQKIARVIHVPIRGYGAALHWGIQKARGKFVIYADADCSYDFREVAHYKPLLPNVDLILGSRFRGTIKVGAMPWLHRYVGTPVLTLLIWLLYGLPVSDCNSGMRLVRKAFYKKLTMHNSGMEWASELLIKTALVGGRYAEVPITLNPDKRGRAPHLLSWADGWRHLKAIILLKPNSLILLVLGLLGVGIVFESLKFYALFAACGLLLSLLAAKLLQYAIDGTPSLTIKQLLTLPVVPIAIVANAAVALIALFGFGLSNELKIIFSGLVVILDVWVFHIETIKTHVMFRLPKRLRQN